MADGVSMTTKGFEDAIRTLEILPRRIGERALRRGLRKAGQQLRNDLRAAAPTRQSREGHRSDKGPKPIGSRSSRTRGSGFLRRKGIVVKKVRSRNAYRVGPIGSAFYAGFLEGGTKRSGARPFLDRTAAGRRPNTFRAIREEIAKAVREEIAKGGLR